MKHPFILACCLLVWTAAAAWSAPAPPKITVSLELKETPLHEALSILFGQSGIPYSIDADVPNLPITLKVHDMPFPEALRALLRLASVSTYIQGAGLVRHDVTYSQVDQLFQIGLRGDSPPSELSAQPHGLPSEKQVEKIPIRFLRPNEAVTALTQQPLQGIVSIQPIARDNTLIVRGDPDAIQDLKALVELVDVPAKPLSVSVGISGPRVYGAPLAIRSSARSLIGDAVTIDEQAVIGGQLAHLKVTLRTQLLGTGDLQIASDWDVLVPVAGGPKGPIRLVKRLSTTTQLRPGEQASVAEVDLSGWGGKGVLRLWLRGDWGGRSPAVRNAR